VEVEEEEEETISTVPPGRIMGLHLPKWEEEEAEEEAPQA